MNQTTIDNIIDQLTGVGFKLVGAVLIWIFGKWLINLGMRLVSRGLRGKVEPTIIKYLNSALSITLQIILIVAILGFFGVETTSFAALLAAAGVAIGAAWGGLLANFAAGVFLVFLRPFKVGDIISAGGITGVVEELGLFGTTINTPDNVRTIVGNNAIFSGNIQNYSANPYRRVDLTAQIGNSVDHGEAMQLLRAKISQIPNVLSSPAPDLGILEFNLAGPVLAVRPYCAPENYWQVYFDTNRIIRETFGEAGYPAPEQRYLFHSESVK
ncbi:MAG: mechanosensitive ion channel family protein [Hydrococcus sp. CRU_1_1]|jgi:small conductance mechanosensitive channel|nr:mechanosensitive ion channel family protein [Hydrococcus sp. CRU_1_1]